MGKEIATWQSSLELSFFTGRGAVCLWSRVVNFFWPPFYMQQKILAPLLANAKKIGPPSWVPRKNNGSLWEVMSYPPASWKQICPPPLWPLKKFWSPLWSLEKFCPPHKQTALPKNDSSLMFPSYVSWCVWVKFVCKDRGGEAVSDYVYIVKIGNFTQVLTPFPRPFKWKDPLFYHV